MDNFDDGLQFDGLLKCGPKVRPNMRYKFMHGRTHSCGRRSNTCRCLSPNGKKYHLLQPPCFTTKYDWGDPDIEPRSAYNPSLRWRGSWFWLTNMKAWRNNTLSWKLLSKICKQIKCLRTTFMLWCSSFTNSWVAAHNVFRCMHGLPNVKYNTATAG